MNARLQKPFSTLLAMLLALNTLTLTGAPAEPDASTTAQAAPPAQASMPDDLMRAFLEASAQPFEANTQGYTARSGGLDFTLDAGGLQATGEGFVWSLVLDGFGREGQTAPVSDPGIAQSGGRLEYRRGPLTEWYRNTALGVEQGFTLYQAPPGTGTLILQLDLSTSIEDLAVTPDADGGGLSFAFPGGQTLHYDHLRARDAGDIPLKAYLIYANGQVIFEVYDQEAEYPITIDPLIHLEQEVPAEESGGWDEFGYAVALSGDTALVGAKYDAVGGNFDQGSAYVFTRSGTTWTQQALLTAADGAMAHHFGCSVALDGDTALVGAYTGANANQGSAYVFTRSGTAWTQQAQLTAADGEAGDNFGASVALSGDTALVGARLDDVGANFHQGSAYVFTRSGTVWTQQSKLTAADGAADDRFGESVALSGDTALVGAYLDNFVGSAYVFTRSGTSWAQQEKLTAADGASGDYFGSSVALSGGTALVGAYRDDVGVSLDQGSAYVYTRSGTTWTQQAQLTAAGRYFGARVALSGDTALVGAALADEEGGGSAYVFTRSGSTWTQQAQLIATGGSEENSFGHSVSLSGDTALVGAPHDDVGLPNTGSAYVFTRSGTVWAQQARLTAHLEDEYDYFGYSVALSGDTALVGVPYDDVGLNWFQGSVIVFIRSGTTWTQQARLTAADGAADDRFGRSVALSGDTALVGALYDDVGANHNQGSAYVFTRSGTVWTQQAQLTASDGVADDYFGWSVALEGDMALVGTTYDDVGVNENQGSAYVFTRSGMVWTQQAQLTALDGEAGDRFGWSVALEGDTALVGAIYDDVGGNPGQGSAYVFTRSGTQWSQQAQLTATDGEEADFFGCSVALAGDTALVGAYYDDVGPNTDQGSAYVFTYSGTEWSQQVQLTAADGAAWDGFGSSVALSGDTALVGVLYDNVGANYDQGSAYVFTRSGTEWTQQAQLTAPDGEEEDRFGVSVALSGDTALVGAYLDDIGFNFDQGSAYVFGRSGTAWALQAKLAHNFIRPLANPIYLPVVFRRMP